MNKNKLARIYLFPIFVLFLFGIDVRISLATSGRWENVGNIAPSVNEVNDINLIYNPSDGFPYVAYTYNNGSFITVKKYNGLSWQNVGLDWYNECYHNNLSLAVRPDNNRLYIAYHESCEETESETIEIFYFDDLAWIRSFNGHINNASSPMSFAFNPQTNEPHVAYVDATPYNFKLNVKKFNGTSWNNVGNSDFSAGYPSNVSLAFNPYSFEPYVAYDDTVESLKIKKLSENNWINVGVDEFSFGYMYKVSLSFNPSSALPYVGYERNPGIVGVISYDGFKWNNVAPEIGGSETNNNLSNLAFDNLNNSPYIVFSYKGVGKEKINAVSSKNNDWDYLGSFNMPQDGEGVEWISLFINPESHIPYVAFNDKSQPNVVMVKKFNPDADSEFPSLPTGLSVK